MNTVGLWMLGSLAILIVATGLPVWALLVGVASLFAGAGVAFGALDATILAAVGPRIVALLEHDLLQAMPLYVFVGVLLQRLAVADALFASAETLFARTGAAAPLAGLAVGGLIAPMNGSVASSSALLSRLVAPHLAHVQPARRLAVIGAAATIGVVVPPSLVLILLGDAMMRAHTEAANLPGSALGNGRIVNTQDILHAALPAAALVLVFWAFAAWWANRAEPVQARTSTTRQRWLAAAGAAGILWMLAGVFLGKVFAVEAAAAAGCVLAVGALATRSLTRRQWRDVLLETLALSGALFALLVGATTFSLVFRLFGTDRWLAEVILQSSLQPRVTAALVLLAVALCAWVLDAFEMIFVVIPIVAPLLVVQLADAQQVAVLLLLVLQLSFLLPPLGYAILMAKSQAGLTGVRTRALFVALSPFLGAQLLVAASVFAWPALAHLLDAPVAAASSTPAPSDEDVVRQMEEMSRDAAGKPLP